MPARLFLLFLLGLASFATVADEGDDTSDLVFILDASNSMWGQIDGTNKIVIAREAVGSLIDELPDATEVGLVAYGHRREGDCEDIEVLSPIAPLDKAALKDTIDGINPKGKTPITASIEAALGLVDDDRRTAVVLISDGLETCGRDPCQAVRSAKASGRPFVLHVIGFDVAGEDTSELECAAQEGGGLFLNAGSAPELSAALRTAYEKPVTPDGRLVVGATADGRLQDAIVLVRDRATGEQAGGGRTYTSADTNPRRIPLEDGEYRASVEAVGIKGAPKFEFDFGIAGGGSVARDFDFSAGEIAVGVTRNGALSDAAVFVYKNGERTNVAGGRTYRAARSNPVVLKVAAGTYDVRLKSVEVANAPERVFTDVVVRGNERTELNHAFESGVLRIEARHGDALTDAVINLYDADGNSAGGGRTHTTPDRNPKSIDLAPGDYVVRITEVRGERRELPATVTAGETAELVVDFGQP